jgi:CheY-like chemotaxis protein
VGIARGSGPQAIFLPHSIFQSQKMRIYEMKQNKYTILIVDDDPDDCLLIKEALRENYEETDVDIVADGSDLLGYLRELTDQGLPNLIVMDTHMPKMDGLEVLREIKADSRFKGIPVVIMTGLALDAGISGAYESGANTVIEKPNSFEELTLVMKRVCDYWFRVSSGLPSCFGRK